MHFWKSIFNMLVILLLNGGFKNLKKLFILLLYLSVCQDILSRILQCLDFQNSTLSGFLVETISRIFFMNSKINKIQSFISTKHIKNISCVTFCKWNILEFISTIGIIHLNKQHFNCSTKINLKSFLSSEQSNIRPVFYWFLMSLISKGPQIIFVGTLPMDYKFLIAKIPFCNSSWVQEVTI